MGTEPTRRKRVGNEKAAFGKLMAALTTLKRKDPVSEFDCDVYEGATARIPMPILSRAVAKIIQTQKWFPTVSEILESCEAVRVEMRGQLQFTRCEDSACSAQGWIERVVCGEFRMVRCECWEQHQERVKALGVPETPLALPAAKDDDE